MDPGCLSGRLDGHDVSCRASWLVIGHNGVLVRRSRHVRPPHFKLGARGEGRPCGDVLERRWREWWCGDRCVRDVGGRLWSGW